MSLPTRSIRPAELVRKNPADIVPELAAQIAKKLGPLNLREFQDDLYRKQRAARTSGLQRALKRVRQLKHRGRVRQRVLSACKVVDTGTDTSKQNLYLELENGQVVSTRRILRTRHTIQENVPEGYSVRSGKGNKREKSRSANPVLRKIVLEQLEKNIKRETAPATPAAQ